ncbi:MAG: phosphotransferase [Planctomycetes bacterium]|nr:phosphotransferase [Planctomycetota bacterium]MBI3847338.1 phosphotransferase [Planctomycetota bacterium]
MTLANSAVVPGRFRIVEGDRGRKLLIVRDGYEDALGPLLDLPYENLLALPSSGPIRRFRGRGAPISFAIPGHPGERAFVRTYRRGGLLRHVLPNCFHGSARPMRELGAVERACEGGVATARALALLGERRWFGFFSWRIALVEIPGSIDLERFFRARRTAPGARRVRSVIREASRTVAALHAAGLDHADLHLKNLLVDESGEGPVFVVDLDKATHHDPLPLRRVEANLLRLDRSVEKQRRRGVILSRCDRLRFLRDYGKAGLPPRAALRRLLRRRARTLWWHRLGWSLSELVRGGASHAGVDVDA